MTVGGHQLPLRDYRRQVQMVFQDSYSSLNPRLTMEQSVAFGPSVHGVSQRESLERARDLAVDPRLVILDEAVSALDKSVEAQVLNLLLDLKDSLNLTYVFISHDLHVVRYLSDRIMVMYLGEIVEVGPAEELFAAAQHPYTSALLSSMPSMDPSHRTLMSPLTGDPPSPIDPPSGCRFHTRCPHAEAICAQRKPNLHLTGEEHYAACLMVEPGAGHSQSPSGVLLLKEA